MKAIQDSELIKLYPIVCFGMITVNQLFEYKNSDSKEKTTLLHVAVMHSAKDVIALLLHNSADPTIKNSNGISPEDLALVENKIEILELLQNA